MDPMIATRSAADLLVSLDLAESKGETNRLSAAQTEILDRARIKLAQGDATAALAVDSLLALTLTMPAYRFDAAAKAVAALARKAAKRGLPQPLIEEVERETREDGGVWVTCRLLGAAPILNGWRCLATVVPWTDGSAVVCTASGVDALPSWGERPEHCDHCNTNRKRSLTFIVGHEDGRVVQVGRSCLNDYLGADALAAWFVWSKLRELESTYGDGSYSVADNAEWLANHARAATRRAKGPRMLPTLSDFLAACAASIRLHGYQKSSYYERTMGTGEQVHRAISDASHDLVLPEDHETAAKTLAYLADLDASDPASLSQWDLHVLDTVSQVRTRKGETVPRSIANHIAATILSASRPRQLNEHVPGAVVGEPLTLAVTPERSLGWALQCRDDAGRCVILRGAYLLAHGERVEVSGTVAELGRYRGTAQTILTDARS